MTETLLSLISLSIGIIGANTTLFFFKKYSFGITGNTIAGVFGSAFLIKSFGRLGFDPNSIMKLGNVNGFLFSINTVISFYGGLLAVIFIYKMKNKIQIK